MTQDNALTGKDALSANELGSGTTSPPASKQTSKEKKDKGEVLTPEAKQKLISDAKAEEGRRWKQVEVERDQLKNEVGTLTTRLDDIETSQRARAYEEARSDPSGNAIRAVQAEESVRAREKKMQEREAEANRREAQLKADRDTFNTESGESMVSIVAARHGVDLERLTKLGITDKAALESVAADMKANAPATETKPEELTDEQKAAKAEAEEKGETYSPTDETPTGAKLVELTTEGVEKASMESLEQTIAPPIK